jgi:hypothetical protein
MDILPMNTPLSLALRYALGFLFVSALAAFTAQAADSGWAGQYADKNFNGGKSVFQLTIEQSGGAIQVSFDAAHNDAHGAAPEGQGPAKVSGKDTLTFKFEDSFSNSGTGTIKRSGSDIIVSMKTTHVADARCLVFYRENMRLKSAGKK